MDEACDMFQSSPRPSIIPPGLRRILLTIFGSTLLAALLLSAFLSIPTFLGSDAPKGYVQLVAEMRSSCQVEKGNAIDLLPKGFRCLCNGFYVEGEKTGWCLKSVCVAKDNPCYPGTCYDDISRQKNYTCKCPDGSDREDNCPTIQGATATLEYLVGANDDVFLDVQYATEKRKSLKLIAKFIFTKTYSVFVTEIDKRGQTKIKKLEFNKSIYSLANGHAFSDSEGKASLFIVTKEPLKVFGILDHNIKLSHEVLSKPEDISVIHTVKTMKKQKPPILHPISEAMVGRLIKPPKVFHRRSASLPAGPAEITIQVLVLLDSKNVDILGGKVDNAMAYVATYWNKVNELFLLEVDCPGIHIVIAGVILLSTSVENVILSYHNQTTLNGEATEENLRNWMKTDFLNEFDAPQFDVVHCHFKDRLYAREENYTLHGSPTMFIASDGKHDCVLSGWRMLVTDEAGEYTGLTSTLYALGWWLSGRKDGFPNTPGCSASDGFIMAGPAMKHYHFSSCTINYMKENLRNYTLSSCFWKSFHPFYVADILPGSMISADEQCRRAMKNSEAYFIGKVHSNICQTITCGNKSDKVSVPNVPALDGTPCGYKKMCLEKKCSTAKYPTMTEICQKVDKDSFAPWEKNDFEVICMELKCRKYNGDVNQFIVTPVHGTPCYTGKLICFNGKCSNVEEN